MQKPGCQYNNGACNKYPNLTHTWPYILTIHNYSLCSVQIICNNYAVLLGLQLSFTLLIKHPKTTHYYKYLLHMFFLVLGICAPVSEGIAHILTTSLNVHVYNRKRFVTCIFIRGFSWILHRRSLFTGNLSLEVHMKYSTVRMYR